MGNAISKLLGFFFYLLHLPLRHTPVNTRQQEIAILGLISQPLHHQVLPLNYGKAVFTHLCQNTNNPTIPDIPPTLFNYSVYRRQKPMVGLVSLTSSETHGRSRFSYLEVREV